MTIGCDRSRKFGELANRFVGRLRCLPCHECVKLDDELFDTDPVILLAVEQIACAWLVTMNGLDLSLFRYDTEESVVRRVLPERGEHDLWLVRNTLSSRSCIPDRATQQSSTKDIWLSNSTGSSQ
jgi:hypothetical protein